MTTAIDPDTGFRPGTVHDTWIRDDTDALDILEEAVVGIEEVAGNMRLQLLGKAEPHAETLDNLAELVWIVRGYINGRANN